jgi:hypothetical protein
MLQLRSINEIGRIDGGRGFQTGENVFRIGRNTFYDRKNEIPMKIPEFKRSGIGLIAEFRGIPNRFPNQATTATATTTAITIPTATTTATATATTTAATTTAATATTTATATKLEGNV